MTDIATAFQDDDRTEDLRALSKMAAHMETLLRDIGVSDNSPFLCLETFRALLAKELELQGELPGRHRTQAIPIDFKKMN